MPSLIIIADNSKQYLKKSLMETIPYTLTGVSTQHTIHHINHTCLCWFFWIWYFAYWMWTSCRSYLPCWSSYIVGINKFFWVNINIRLENGIFVMLLQMLYLYILFPNHICHVWSQLQAVLLVMVLQSIGTEVNIDEYSN